MKKAACSTCISDSSQVLSLGTLTHQSALWVLSISPHRMLKRYVFKYPDLMKVTILLHQGCCLAKPAFVYHQYLAVKAAMTAAYLGAATPAVLPTVAFVPSAQMSAQRRRQIMCQYFYENDSDFLDLLKRSQVFPGSVDHTLRNVAEEFLTV